MYIPNKAILGRLKLPVHK